MIDDILARLRQAADEFHLHKTPEHAIADRARPVWYETDQSNGLRGCDTRSVRHDGPSADEIVTLHRPQTWTMCGRDGAGPCPQEFCYKQTGCVCPRLDACGISVVPGYSAKRGQL